MKKQLLVILVLWLTAVSVNYFSRFAYPIEIMEEIRFVPQKEVIEVLSLDHKGLAADMLFIQTIIHSGSLMWKPLKYQFDSDWSYQVMDVVTKMDPRYLTAYLFSGMGLVHGPEDVRLARPILERGMTNFPGNWEFPFWIGYLHYTYLEDYVTAGEYFWRAANCPNAPRTFLSLMLSSLQKGGSYERAILALRLLIENTDNEKVVLIYQKRIVSLENMVMLQKAANHYRIAKGEPLIDLNQLVEENLVPEIPEDPFGKSYLWDTEHNRVVITDRNRVGEK
jgi:hypothetical protein